MLWVTKITRHVADRAPDAQQFVVHALARHLVERAERLVHQHDLRLECQRAGDADALLHPAGKLPGILVLEFAQFDQLEHGAGALDRAWLWNTS